MTALETVLCKRRKQLYIYFGVHFRREPSTTAFGGWSMKKLIKERLKEKQNSVEEVANQLRTTQSFEVADLSRDVQHVKISKGKPVSLERR